MTVCWYPNGEWKGEELKIFGIFISQWKTESYNDVWSTLFQERISHTNILPLLSFFLLHLYLITVDIHSMKHTNSLQSSSCLKKRKVVWFLIFFYNKGKFRGSFHDYLSSYFRLVWICTQRFVQVLSNSMGKSTNSVTGCCDDQYWFTNSFSRIARIWARGILNKDTNSRKKFLILL